MESTFAQSVDQWHDFYLMAGTAGATLIGLLFVSVSLHIEILTDESAAAVLASARRAFTSFILIMMIALVFLVPSQTSQGLGIPMLAFSIAELYQTVWVLRILRREYAHLIDLLGKAADVGRVGIGLAGSLGLLAISLTLLKGSTHYLGWLVAVIGILLVGAAESCWSLLLDLAVARRRRDERQTSAGANTDVER